MNAQLIWTAACEELRRKLDTDSFERFLLDVRPVTWDAEACRLVLGVDTDFLRIWLENSYSGVIRDVLTSNLKQPIDVVFESGHAPPNPSPETGAVSPAKRRGKGRSESSEPRRPTGPPGCRPEFTFESFIVGPNNRIPVAAAQAVVDKPGRAYNPLFLYGGTGLGKTHLLQAIAHAVLQRRKKARIEFLSSEDFVNDYVEAMMRKTPAQFRRRFRNVDFLLVDDVQFFVGKDASCEEFFHTFNALHNARKQIVLVSDRTPTDLKGLEARLVSRFDWGVSCEIMPPADMETRLAILKKKQEQQEIKLNEEVLALIAERISSNIRNLESALSMLVMNVSTFGGDMTVQRAEELLGDRLEAETLNAITPEGIMRVVAEHFDLRMAELTGNRRPKNVAVPRMIAMHLSRTLTNLSSPAIGQAFNRDHATVLHAAKTIKKRMEADTALRQTVEHLTRTLRS